MLAPHHDGSPLCVSDPAPRLGDTVRVRVRIPHSFGQVAAVRTRSNPNHEPCFTDAKRVATADGWDIIKCPGGCQDGQCLKAPCEASERKCEGSLVYECLDDGSGWQYAWPTGAAGQPATAYAADGHPDLFVLSASAGVQVFRFSGQDLHGTMNWVSAGVQTVNPPGVTTMPGGGVVLSTVSTDGQVDLFTTHR